MNGFNLKESLPPIQYTATKKQAFSRRRKALSVGRRGSFLPKRAKKNPLGWFGETAWLFRRPGDPLFFALVRLEPQYSVSPPFLYPNNVRCPPTILRGLPTHPDAPHNQNCSEEANSSNYRARHSVGVLEAHDEKGCKERHEPDIHRC